MKVCIVGAGASGLVTARTLLEFGHEVTVLERNSEVGGVWSQELRYPGVTTQNTADLYSFSDLPMPKDYPEWPSGQQVQAYFESWAQKHRLHKHIRFGTEVLQARDDSARAGRPQWTVVTRQAGASGNEAGSEETYDFLVVCNGTFCAGKVPTYLGAKQFQAAGGKVLHTTHLPSSPAELKPMVAGKDVLVVGYGKSACDAANIVADSGAKSTTVIARDLVWKMPHKLLGLNYKYLLMTRFGEALFEYINLPNAFEYALHRTPLRFLRNALVESLGTAIDFQLGLSKLGLRPHKKFETIARASISLATEGFYKKVHAGQIRVIRDVSIQELHASASAKDGKTAVLSDQTTLPADLVLCGTGYDQRASFLPKEVTSKLTDEHGNWTQLYRHILPVSVEGLAFNGYNSSLFCTISSEIAALWIAAYLEGQLRFQRGHAHAAQGAMPAARTLDDEREQAKSAQDKFNWLDERSKGKHAKGTNLVPFSLHAVDEMLDDLDLQIGWGTRMLQWLLPVRPQGFDGLLDKLLKRVSESRAAAKRAA